MTSADPGAQIRARLHKVLSLLDSQEEGEATAALRQARRLLREGGLTMRQVLGIGDEAPAQGPDNLTMTSLKAYVEDLKTRLAEAQTATDAWRRKAELYGAAPQEVAALKRRLEELEEKHRAELEAARRQLIRAEAVKLKAAQDQAQMWRRKAEGLAARQRQDRIPEPGNRKSEPRISVTLMPTVAAAKGPARPAAPSAEQSRPAGPAAAPSQAAAASGASQAALEARIAELEQALDRSPRRSNAAKRAAVLGFLRDPLTAQQSDREIARQAGVAPQTVSNWRRRLREDGGPPPPRERLVRRRGRSYAMRVGNIGQGAGDSRL